MSIRTILAALSGTAMDKRVLNAALDIGRSSEARITALYGEADQSEIPAAYVGYGIGMYLPLELSKGLEKQIAEKRHAVRRHFDDWQTRAGLPDAGANIAGPTALLQIGIGSVSVLLGRHGPTADLVVAALPNSGEADTSLVLEAALFDTGRPVLALPATGPTGISQTAPIAIAWNGRPEAARALAAALPILARSHSEVILMSVGDSERPEVLRPVVDYLAMHGIAAKPHYLADRSGGTGALLLEEAGKLDAGLLVMGAYSHSRWRELILGGVTHHVIKHAALPVLFAH